RGDARATVPEDDARTQVARRVRADRADGRRLIQGIFELSQIVCALVARLEMGGEREPLGLVERAKRECGQIFGRMTLFGDAHRSSTRRSRSFVMPRRTRLFTVPS